MLNLFGFVKMLGILTKTTCKCSIIDTARVLLLGDEMLQAYINKPNPTYRNLT